eukprot:scaffold203044_cov46-Cyclotella_meneghiniana.AAC.1
MPSAVELSVCMGVGGCLWPISSNIFRSSTALRALIYNPPVSVSAADDMTALIISATLWMAPLLGGRGTFSDRK